MWAHPPPEPVPIDAVPERQWASRPDPARPSRMLPVVQCLAEGGLLALVAAALQVLFGEVPIIGPFEFAILAGAGMAWARRSRWRGPAAEAFGLPVLAVTVGALAWLLGPDVRVALLQGDAQAALSSHPGGWIGAVAFWRGHAHHSRVVDEEVQDQLMRWGLPAAGIAWLIGDVAASEVGPSLLEPFTAVAFIGSLVFLGSGVLALGLARLATVRGDGPGGGSWFGFALLVALAVTVLAIPAAMVLGVPLEMLIVALVAPIRVVGAFIVLIFSPVILLAALFADLARDLLPEGFGQGIIQMPVFDLGVRQPTSPLPGILFFVVLAVIILIELAAIALYIWWRWHVRRDMDALMRTVVEERSVVFERPAREPRPPRPRPGAGLDRNDPVAAYLVALDALAADGRWARHAAETPRDHLARIAPPGPLAAALARLAAGYQLIRYAGRTLGDPERRRAASRLDRLERLLRETGRT